MAHLPTGSFGIAQDLHLAPESEQNGAEKGEMHSMDIAYSSSTSYGSGQASTQSLGNTSSHLRPLSENPFIVAIHQDSGVMKHKAEPNDTWLEVRKAIGERATRIYVWAWMENGKHQVILLGARDALIRYTELESVGSVATEERVVHVYLTEDAAKTAGQPSGFTRQSNPAFSSQATSSRSSGSFTAPNTMVNAPVTLRSPITRSPLPLVEGLSSLDKVAYGERDGVATVLNTLCTDWGSKGDRREWAKKEFGEDIHPLLYVAATQLGGTLWAWTLECAVLPMAEILGRCLNHKCDCEVFDGEFDGKRFETKIDESKEFDHRVLEEFYQLFNTIVLPSGHNTADLALARFMEEANRPNREDAFLKGEVDCLRRLPILPVLFAARNVYGISAIITRLEKSDQIPNYPKWNTWERFITPAFPELFNLSSVLKQKISMVDT